MQRNIQTSGAETDFSVTVDHSSIVMCAAKSLRAGDAKKILNANFTAVQNKHFISQRKKSNGIDLSEHEKNQNFSCHRGSSTRTSSSSSKISAPAKSYRFTWAARFVNSVRNLRLRHQFKVRKNSEFSDVHTNEETKKNGRFHKAVRNIFKPSASASLSENLSRNAVEYLPAVENLQISEENVQGNEKTISKEITDATVTRKFNNVTVVEIVQKDGFMENFKERNDESTAHVSHEASEKRNSADIRFTEYVVNVKTSDRFGAGTDAKVYLQLFGEDGASDVFSLANSNNVNKFERNQLDRFVFRSVRSVGQIKSLRVWHDNAGVGAPWHLAYVEVSDTSLGLLFRFPCHAWLADNAESMGTSRDLRCFEVLEGPKKAVQRALGVSKTSLASLSGSSRPVTPVPQPVRKGSNLDRIAMPPANMQCLDRRRNTSESVFTPTATRPPALIRLPLTDDEEEDEKPEPRGVQQRLNLSPRHSNADSSTLAKIHGGAKKNKRFSLTPRNVLISPGASTSAKKRSVYEQQHTLSPFLISGEISEINLRRSSFSSSSSESGLNVRNETPRMGIFKEDTTGND